jgi:hypothetical protein
MSLRQKLKTLNPKHRDHIEKCKTEKENLTTLTNEKNKLQ